jgi:AraC-like DNA-binding protein
VTAHSNERARRGNSESGATITDAPGPYLLYSEVAAGAALTSHIECYWQIRGDTGAGAARNRVLPDGCMDVIFDLGDSQPSNRRADRYSEYVVGAMREALVVEHAGRVDIMGIRFRPGCASSVLGVPAMELTEQVAALCEFWRDGGVLRERLAAETRGSGVGDRNVAVKAVAANEARRLLAMRAALLERVLTAQTRGAPGLDPVVAEAVRWIHETKGGVTVKEMERRLGVSERTLLRRFAAAVGLTPKEASRVARFLAAARALQRDPRTSLARLAATTGYSDQAHFTREFSRLAGTTPAAYARERGDGFVQDDHAGSP